MTWLLLAGAILSEVAATLSLRMASQPGGSRRWFVAVGTGYPVAFTLLALALDAGIALGVAYGIWAAAGVALTAIASRVLFNEPLTRVMALGIGLIAAGVLLIELGAGHH
ncbi:multidrug efflux SMR transporter [Streptomyces sp. PT12]|uniref:DMT family transporter n=1 Tax=Streptomyces sp. PT12 TaxID=1510197 RepID=UPI000DE253DA|nr:SMR family transporter [Streptomyces sp. PT12]RBM12374.1 QacE family quaternary ammonium compound efflux SMR transporter [Streptomyces sp. PT12]